MLRFYLVFVVLTALAAIGSVIYTSAQVDHRSHHAAEDANGAVAAAKIQTELRRPLALLFVNAYAYIGTPEGAAVAPNVREALGDVLDQFDNPAPVTTSGLPGLTLPIDEKTAFELQRDFETISNEIDQLAASPGNADLTSVISANAAVKGALDDYLETKSLAAYRDMFSNTVLLGARLQDASDAFSFGMISSQESLNSATSLARTTMVGALLLLTVTMCIATMFVSRTIQGAFQDGEAERRELRETTATLRYRNDQLNALYNVFAEITDTLSMRYVISATLRETLRVMSASMVTLRLVRGSQLVMAGNLTAEGREVPELPPVPLGEGPTGRVARRGRSMRIGRGAQEMLGPSTDPNDPNSGVESGIIVPLIVGARIVGTLACWSRRPDAFAEEDERVLEMMASQVATAVIAADTTETSERRALQDPLTGLPNRRQLNEDIAGVLARWVEDGRKAVVAMVDIDNFKRLNDDFGHRVGDVTLQKVASVMRLSIRDSDRIYRYGGEEFVVIYADAGRVEAILLAERLLRAVADTPLSGDSLEPVGPVTMSAGLALMPDDGTDITKLIELADRAMYRAKEAGRNRVHLYDEDVTPAGPSVAA
jgi:diguanylate cyclase (GGDEF)-like protein